MSTIVRKLTFKYKISFLLYFLSVSVMASETVKLPPLFGSLARMGGISYGYSADGRYVATESFTTNIVIYDRQTHQKNIITKLGFKPSLSANGRFVAFQTGGGSSGGIFVHDRQTQQTKSASINDKGVQGNGDSSEAVISADGRFVTFVSAANNLVAGDTNGVDDIFVHDRQTKKTSRISVRSNGAEGNDTSYRPSLSANGRFVTYFSAASNLVTGDTNGFMDVFVHDRQTQQTTRVSVSSNGLQANSGNVLSPSLSANGRFVVFVSDANNLVTGDTNNTYDVFVHDRQTQQTSRVSVAPDGTQGNSFSFSPSISADGRFVAFDSDADNLVSGDINGFNDAFVHDRQTKKTTRVSIDTIGMQANDDSFWPIISADGRYVAFQSWASNLVAGVDTHVHDEDELYIHDRLLDTAHHADLKVTSSLRPWSLVANSWGVYVFTITNNGPDVVNNVRTIHLLSNEHRLLGLIPSQGYCNRYATISLCQFGKLRPGDSLILVTVAKAVRDPLIQSITVSGNPVDTVPANNKVTVSP